MQTFINNQTVYTVLICLVTLIFSLLVGILGIFFPEKLISFLGKYNIRAQKYWDNHRLILFFSSLLFLFGSFVSLSVLLMLLK